MRNKCKFCGYRFKDRDERICPECFTAREDDISCGQFSDDLHSHEIFGDRYSRQDYGSPENDTFKEEQTSFVEEERREEQQSKFSKIEQMHKSQPLQTEFIPKSGDGVYNKTDSMPYNNNTTNNIPNGSFPRQTVNQFQRTPTGFITPGYNKRNRKNNSGCAISIFVIVIVIIVINVFITIAGTFIDNDNDYDYNYYEDDIDYEDNGFSNYTTETQYSSYKDYFLEQNYYNAYYYDNTYLEEERFSHLTLGDNSYDGSGEMTYFVDEPTYSIYTSYTLTAEEGSEGRITSVVCEGKTYSGELLSTYAAPQSELENKEDYYDNEFNVTPVMICSGKAEVIDITVTVSYDGEDEKFTFRLDLDADE